MNITTKQNKHRIGIHPDQLQYLSKMAVAEKCSIEQVLSKVLAACQKNGIPEESSQEKPGNAAFTPRPQVSIDGRSTIQLTEEQKFAVQCAVEKRENMAISAFAGSGKTYTILEIAKRLPKVKGLYLTFNRRNADEAQQKFPSNIHCRTAHQLAFRAIGHKYSKRLGRRLTGFDLAKNINLTPLKNFTRSITGEMVLGTLNAFCYSSDIKLGPQHVNKEYLDMFEDSIERSFNTQLILDYTRQAWQLLVDPNGELAITHDLYLKMWALGNPTLPYNLIVVDEAQDSNSALISVLRSQDCQVIWVGDPYQSLYQWRGAVNAMRQLEFDRNCSITQSFRYGQTIADLASAVLNRTLGTDIQIKGSPEIDSYLTTDPCRTILCRTNLKLIDLAMTIYKNNRDVKIHIVGKSENSGRHDELVNLLMGAKDLVQGNRTLIPELRGFSSWTDVVKYSETESGKDLASLVRMVSMWPIKGLLDTLQRISMNSEEDADIVLSTVHKSKGREWSSVKLSDDFRVPGTERFTDEEAYLLYVAVTRASKALNIFDCEACQGLV